MRRRFGGNHARGICGRDARIEARDFAVTVSFITGCVIVRAARCTQHNERPTGCFEDVKTHAATVAQVSAR